MNEKNLNDIQSVLMQIAERNGIPKRELINGWNKKTEVQEWAIDYKSPLESDFRHDLDRLLKAFELVEKAMSNSDMMVVKAGLIFAAMSAQNLMSVFEDIHHDCYKMVQDDPRFTWPRIPDDYRVPEQYGFERR